MKEKRTYKRFDLLSILAILGCIGMLLFECIFIFELYDRIPLQPETPAVEQPAVEESASREPARREPARREPVESVEPVEPVEPVETPVAPAAPASLEDVPPAQIEATPVVVPAG